MNKWLDYNARSAPGASWHCTPEAEDSQLCVMGVLGGGGRPKMKGDDCTSLEE